jgi:hypothetical protein
VSQPPTSELGIADRHGGVNFASPKLNGPASRVAAQTAAEPHCLAVGQGDPGTIQLTEDRAGVAPKGAHRQPGTITYQGAVQVAG